jgi:hypothetical protein
MDDEPGKRGVPSLGARIAIEVVAVILILIFLSR